MSMSALLQWLAQIDLATFNIPAQLFIELGKGPPIHNKFTTIPGMANLPFPILYHEIISVAERLTSNEHLRLNNIGSVDSYNYFAGSEGMVDGDYVFCAVEKNTPLVEKIRALVGFADVF